jgi:hypothetical protein
LFTEDVDSLSPAWPRSTSSSPTGSRHCYSVPSSPC